MSTLRVPGQVVSFVTRHVSLDPVASDPEARQAVKSSPLTTGIPVVRFAKGQRKLEVMRPHLAGLARQVRTVVTAIGVVQEFQQVFTATTYHCDEVPRFGHAKADCRVIAYYFSLVDEIFGPAFITVFGYFAYPVKIWFNGHEYAQAHSERGGDRIH